VLPYTTPVCLLRHVCTNSSSFDIVMPLHVNGSSSNTSNKSIPSDATSDPDMPDHVRSGTYTNVGLPFPLFLFFESFL
jgi:hypothetical protein